MKILNLKRSQISTMSYQNDAKLLPKHPLIQKISQITNQQQKPININPKDFTNRKSCH